MPCIYYVEKSKMLNCILLTVGNILKYNKAKNSTNFTKKLFISMKNNHYH